MIDCVGVVSQCGITKPHCSYRDGGLKRKKVKDSYKEEQQKMYSSIIVGQNDFNSPKACSENPEDNGDTGPPLWSSFLPPTLPRDMWTGWTLLVWTENCIDSESLILRFWNVFSLKAQINFYILIFKSCVCVGVYFNQQEAVYDNTIIVFILLLLMPLSFLLSMRCHTVWASPVF